MNKNNDTFRNLFYLTWVLVGLVAIVYMGSNVIQSNTVMSWQKEARERSMQMQQQLQKQPQTQNGEPQMIDNGGMDAKAKPAK